MSIERTIKIYEQQLASGAEVPWASPRLLASVHAGYSDGTLSTIIGSRSSQIAKLRSLGIIDENGGEALSGHFTFPANDTDRNPIGIIGIHPETLATIYIGNERVWSPQPINNSIPVIITDSIPDALQVIDADFTNVLAVPDASALKTFEINTVKVVIIAEDPGVIANHLNYHHNVLQIKTDDALWRLGKDTVAALLSPKLTAPRAIQIDDQRFELTINDRTYEIIDPKRQEQKLTATIMVKVGESPYGHADTLDLFQGGERKAFIREAARTLQLDVDVLQQDLSIVLEAALSVSPKDAPTLTLDLDNLYRHEATDFGRSNDVLQRIVDDISNCGCVGYDDQKLLTYIVATSRLMNDPLAIRIDGTGGSGKSTMIDAISDLLPKESYQRPTSLTSKSLNYQRPDALRNKLLVIEESEGVKAPEATLRGLLANRGITSQSASREPITSKLVTKSHHIDGPTAIIITSSKPSSIIDNLVLKISLIPCEEHTGLVLKHQRRQRSILGLQDEEDKPKIINKHKAFQRLLKPLYVVNPLVDEIQYSGNGVQCHRQQEMFLKLIDAIAFLKQMGKQVQTHGEYEYIEVDADDITIAHRLMQIIVPADKDNLSAPANSILRTLIVNIEKMTVSTFYRQDVVAWTDYGSTHVSNALSELLDADYIEQVSGGKGRKHLYRLIAEGAESFVATLPDFTKLSNETTLEIA